MVFEIIKCTISHQKFVHDYWEHDPLLYRAVVIPSQSLNMAFIGSYSQRCAAHSAWCHWPSIRTDHMLLLIWNQFVISEIHLSHASSWTVEWVYLWYTYSNSALLFIHRMDHSNSEKHKSWRTSFIFCNNSNYKILSDKMLLETSFVLSLKSSHQVNRRGQQVLKTRC